MKDFIVQLSGVRKDLCGYISSLPINLRGTAEFQMLLESYISLGAVIRYIFELDPSVSSDSSLSQPQIDYSVLDLDFPVVADSSVKFEKQIYAQLCDESRIVPDVAINAASKMLSVVISSQIHTGSVFDNVSIATMASEVFGAIVSESRIVNSSVWHGVSSILTYSELGTLFRSTIQHYINCIDSGTEPDTSISCIVKLVATVGDYYGKMLTELYGGKTLSEMYYVIKGANG